jgi:hypothetical protein
MHKFLIVLVFICSSAFAENVIEWTRLGYIVVTHEDEYISRHVDRKEALESAANHAFNSGNTGLITYKLEYPDERIDIVVPGVAAIEPPLPDEVVDTGAQLDPNTVYFCPAGANGGTTVEPGGSDSNDGTSPFEPFATLAKYSGGPAGMDVRLCEGGVFEDQTLDIVHSGDIGENNRVVLAQYTALSVSAAIDDWADNSRRRWIAENSPELIHPKEIYKRLPIELQYKNYSVIPGWIHEDIDPVIVGCYKIMNGVPRPCMDSYPICELGVATKCLDSETFALRPYYSYQG